MWATYRFNWPTTWTTDISKNILDLEILADTLQRMDNDRTIASVQSFLSRKASALGFTSLVLIDEEGRRCYSTPFEGDLLSQPGVISSFAGQSGVSFLDKESILYSIPIYKEKRGGRRAGRGA